MKVLITAGTGRVGKEVTERALMNGLNPVVMTHSLKNLQKLPDGVEGILADFENPQSWDEALRDIDKLCLVTPPLPDEAKRGCEFIEYAVQKGIKQIVLLSIYYAEAGSHIAHFFAKLEMEETIKKSGIPYTFIRSDNFFQDDEEIFGTLESEGYFILPLGNVGLNRVDMRDVADCMVDALIQPHFHFQTYPVLGQEVWTGRKIAALYSDILRRKIIYPPDALERWEKKYKSHYPQWLFEDKKMMFEFFLLEGSIARGDAFERRDEILKKPPRSYVSFVKEAIERGDYLSRPERNSSLDYR